MKVEYIEPQETHSLRHRVLRPESLESCNFPGDNTASSFHLGIRKNGTIVCIGSFHLEKYVDFSEEKQFRLRGMATDPTCLGQGYGRALLIEAEKILKQRGAMLLWFNAREKAFDFYLKCGFQFHGPLFEIPQVGPHKVMYKAMFKLIPRPTSNSVL